MYYYSAYVELNKQLHSISTLQYYSTYTELFVSFFKLETWILYRGREKGVSKFVREAYQRYGDMEFGNNNEKISYVNGQLKNENAVDINSINRHIKLIGIAREEVCSVGF